MPMHAIDILYINLDINQDLRADDEAFHHAQYAV